MEKLQVDQNYAKLNVRNGWLECPICHRNKRLLRIERDTEARELPVYCRDCKQESILNIEKGQSVERRSQ